MTDHIRRIPISKIATRSNLFMGGDRELVMMSGIIAAVFVFVPQSLFTAVIGVSLWVTSLFALRQLAKHDPYWRQKLMRYSKRYRQKYYAPRSTPFCQGKDK